MLKHKGRFSTMAYVQFAWVRMKIRHDLIAVTLFVSNASEAGVASKWHAHYAADPSPLSNQSGNRNT
jgi:hypothetical protein